ncbi:lactate utilization protein C [Knoellia sp. S7-12]|uniref:LutC/YkgG family protein n=1 Tax=Knoellia sp. S7-12 TaxID=3126698 RepID=UPI00336937F4
MNARDEILARVRAALTDVTTDPSPRLIARLASSSAGERSLGGGQTGNKSLAGAGPETLELFAENVADYQATVIRVDAAAGEPGVGAAIAGVLRELGCTSAVLPGGLEAAWRVAIEADVEVRDEAEATSALVLDTVDAVVTGSAVGIATTGTIVLDHGLDQGRRALTLVPDTHVCVIRAEQIVHDVPEAVARLRTQGAPQRVLTWISGPSATSDIELQRVEGVHGPRNLIVVLVADTHWPRTSQG